MKTGPYCIPLWPVLVLLGACSSAPDSTTPRVSVTPALQLSASAAAGGHAIDATYRFTVARDAGPVPPAQTVFVHLRDDDGEILWTGDHQPPLPSERWMPGDVIEYARPVAVPRGLLGGTASVHVGLYGPSGQRLALQGDDAGGHSYRVATLRVLPPGSEPDAVYREGWHPIEIPDGTGIGEWRWSSGRAVVQMRNPRRSSVLVFELDQPITRLEQPQHVEIRTGGKVVGAFAVAPGQRTVVRLPVSQQDLGDADVVSFQMTIDRTFVPARDLGDDGDPRELGVRLFHAYLAKPQDG